MQILHKRHEFMSETGHAPENFPDKIIFAIMFNDITDHASKKVQGKFLDSAKEVASHPTRFRPGYWCFCGPGSEQTWDCNESRLLLILLTVSGTNSPL